jgi:hypothetical protein
MRWTSVSSGYALERMYGTAFRAFAAFPNLPSFPHFSLITFPSLQLGLQAPAALFFERGLINS